MYPPSATPPTAPPAAYGGPLVSPFGALADPTGRSFVPPAMRAVFNPWDLLHALKRRWLLASVLGLLAAAGAVAGAHYYFRVPERKMAPAIATVAPTQPYKFFRPEGEPEGGYVARLKEEVSLAWSADVIRQAFMDPAVEGLADFTDLSEEEKFKWITSRYNPFGSEKDRTVTLLLVSADHEHWLAPLANALLRAYVKASHENEYQTRQALYEYKKALYMEAGGAVDLQLAELREKQRQRVSSPSQVVIDQEHTNLLTVRAQLQGRKAGIIAEKQRIQIEMDLEREGLATTEVTAEEIQAALDSDADLEELIARIADQEEVIDSSIRAFNDGANHPRVKRMQAELADMMQAEADYRVQRAAAIREELARQREAEVQKALGSYFKDMKRQEILERIVDKELATIETHVKAYSNLVFDTRDLEDQLKVYEPIVSELRQQLNIMERERNADPRVQIRSESPDPPTMEPQPSQLRKIAMAGVCALAVVLAGVSLLEYRTRRIHTVHEVVQGLGLRLLGAIPTWSPASQRSAAYGGTLAYNFWTESVDTARTLVTHAAQAESARVVMVTSATSGEGKTSLASHLASSLARAGHRTLLVDGDLRSPAAHLLFDLPLAPGLCEVLRGQVTLDQAVQTTPARGLALLPAGQWDAAALQALAQGTAQEIFASLKEQYDYVVVDSSPVLAVADALLLGRHVDGVLLSILRNVSRVPTVYAAYQRLSMLGIRTLGAVVNGTENERYGSWYNAPPSAA